MLKSKTHAVDVYVGKRLRRRRQELGMSQEQLGEAVDLTFQQIQKYEKGYNRISCSKLYEFSNILNTSVEYFFMGLKDIVSLAKEYTFEESNIMYSSLDSAKNAYQTENIQDKDLDTTLKELIHYYNKIDSHEAKMQLLTLAKLFADKNLENDKKDQN